MRIRVITRAALFEGCKRLHIERGAMAISRNCQPAQALRAWGLWRL
jgi:hypothetical protein